MTSRDSFHSSETNLVSAARTEEDKGKEKHGSASYALPSTGPSEGSSCHEARL